MSVPSLSLPPELWLEVFHCLSPKELSTICLISEGWHQLAIPMLYENIYLTGGKYPAKCESSAAIAKLKLSPLYAKSVKTCRLGHWELTPGYTSLLELLPLLTHLHTLYCMDVVVDDVLCQCISQLQALCTLDFERCYIDCSTRQPPPPKLTSLVIGYICRVKKCAPLVSFSLAPTLRTLSIWPTQAMFRIPKEWTRESSPTGLTDIRVFISSYTEPSVGATIGHLLSRSPLLKRLVFYRGGHVEIPSSTAPKLESYTGCLSSLLNIVPDRPIGDVSFDIPDDQSPESLDLAFTSICRSTVPVRQLKITTKATHVNQRMLYQISSLFPCLQYLTIKTKRDSGTAGQQTRSVLELLDKEMTRKLCTLRELRSLCLHCFYPSSLSNLDQEMNFVQEFREAMPGLVEVSFSKLIRWEWIEGRWKSSAIRVS